VLICPSFLSVCRLIVSVQISVVTDTEGGLDMQALERKANELIDGCSSAPFSVAIIDPLGASFISGAGANLVMSEYVGKH